MALCISIACCFFKQAKTHAFLPKHYYFDPVSLTRSWIGEIGAPVPVGGNQSFDQSHGTTWNRFLVSAAFPGRMTPMASCQVADVGPCMFKRSVNLLSGFHRKQSCKCHSSVLMVMDRLGWLKGIGKQTV